MIGLAIALYKLNKMIVDAIALFFLSITIVLQLARSLLVLHHTKLPTPLDSECRDGLQDAYRGLSVLANEDAWQNAHLTFLLVAPFQDVAAFGVRFRERRRGKTPDDLLNP